MQTHAGDVRREDQAWTRGRSGIGSQPCQPPASSHHPEGWRWWSLQSLGALGGHPGRAHAGRPWRGPRGPEARLSPLTSPLLCILGSGGNGASAPVNISITVEQSWPPWDMCCHHSGQAGVWRARPGEAEVPGALSFPEGSGMQKPIDSSGRGAARRSAGTGLGAASCLSASTSHGAAA